MTRRSFRKTPAICQAYARVADAGSPARRNIATVRRAAGQHAFAGEEPPPRDLAGERLYRSKSFPEGVIVVRGRPRSSTEWNNANENPPALLGRAGHGDRKFDHASRDVALATVDRDGVRPCS